jgi:hypothetical protein
MKTYSYRPPPEAVMRLAERMVEEEWEAVLLAAERFAISLNNRAKA